MQFYKRFALTVLIVLVFRGQTLADPGIPWRNTGYYVRHVASHAYPYAYRRHHYFGPRFYSYRRPFYALRPHFHFHRHYAYRPYFWRPRFYFRYYARPHFAPYCPPYATYWYSYTTTVPMMPDAGEALPEESATPAATSIARRSTPTPDWSKLAYGHSRGPTPPPRPESTPATTPLTADSTWLVSHADEDPTLIGDQLFRAGRCAEALKQYDSASVRGLDSAMLQVRRTYALVGIGRYAEAAAAIRKGLAMDSSLLRSSFRSNELYEEASSAKTAHIEGLAAAALEDSKNSDALLLIGVFLRFDGESDRAKLFFKRAHDPQPEEPLVLIGGR